MKRFQIEVLLFLTIASCFLTHEIKANECDCFDSWLIRGAGSRQIGDQLLFSEVQSTNHTTVPVVHSFNFTYSDTNITRWDLVIAPTYTYVTYTDEWNPILDVQIGLFGSEAFRVELIAYGFPTENLAPAYIDDKTRHESDMITITNTNDN